MDYHARLYEKIYIFASFFKRFLGMSTSISLNAIRNAYVDEQPYNSPPYVLPQKDPYFSSQAPTPPGRQLPTTFGSAPNRQNVNPSTPNRKIDESFERTSDNRNSLTKRYLSHLGSNGNANVEVRIR